MFQFNLIDRYKKANSRLVLLDYDGTLVHYYPVPDKAIITARMLEALRNLLAYPQTEVVVITGRAYQDIDKLLESLPINIIAEHGAMTKDMGVWQKKVNVDDSWKTKVLPLLNQITLTCPNAFVEEKHYSLAWHYRNADSETGYIHSRELIRLLGSAVQSYRLKIIDGNKVVEITTGQTNKGMAIGYLIEAKNYDCIICIGDDKTDEDMFEYLQDKDNAITIKVGPGVTLAKHRLASVEEVNVFLEKLSQHDS
jgi:trehalose 6-phosphate synthase/phosphatase